MDNKVFCCAGYSPALEYAKANLTRAGFRFADAPGKEVTHLLLPVPSFDQHGQIRGSGNLNDILPKLHSDTTIIGGNIGNIKGLDLLRDSFYVTRNAALTADCAIRFASKHMDIAWSDCRALVLGWGRIGKCLSKSLDALSASVTVAARKEEDRTLASALGLQAISFTDLEPLLSQQDVIFNTVPAPILDNRQVNMCGNNCLLVELASEPGIISDRAVPALGLPGKMVPRSSGKLIAETIIRLISPKEG